MVKNASLIAFFDGDYFVQGRSVVNDKFSAGNFPFIFPGAMSFFGGSIEEGESEEQAFKREMQEELRYDFNNELTRRVYDWRKDVDRVIDKANDVFQGNVSSFLGFDLNSPVPSSALGKNRESLNGISYKDWISRTTEDNFFIYSGKLPELHDREGIGGLWIPHYAMRTMVMVPTDKLALLDDISERVKSGEINLK